MSPQKRRVGPASTAKVVLPSIAEVESDDLGLCTIPVERRCILEKDEGLHIRPAMTVQILSNRLREDFHIVGWFGRDDVRKASTIDITGLESLGVQDREEVIVDLRGPNVFGIDRMNRLLDVYERLLKDSRSLEQIDALPYVKEAYAILGLPSLYE